MLNVIQIVKGSKLRPKGLKIPKQRKNIENRLAKKNINGLSKNQTGVLFYKTPFQNHTVLTNKQLSCYINQFTLKL